MCVVKVYSIVIDSYFSFIQDLYQLLSIREQEQSSKFVTTILQYRYIVTRAVLRIILSRYFGVSPQSLQFKTNAFGKPFIDDKINFNMSHSLNRAYYAVSTSIVGIDVEFFNRVKNVDSIARSVFTTQELNLFLTLLQYRRQDFFFSVWTKKEAIIKAIGVGLSYPMDAIDTLVVADKGYLNVNGDYYYLHTLNACTAYKAHLVIKNCMSASVQETSFVVSDLCK